MPQNLLQVCIPVLLSFWLFEHPPSLLIWLQLSEIQNFFALHLSSSPEKLLLQQFRIRKRASVGPESDIMEIMRDYHKNLLH